MTVQLEIELPDDAFSVLKIGPKDFVREMKLAAVVKWYEMGMIEVTPFQTSPEELEREIAYA